MKLTENKTSMRYLEQIVVLTATRSNVMIICKSEVELDLMQRSWSYRSRNAPLIGKGDIAPEHYNERT